MFESLYNSIIKSEKNHKVFLILIVILLYGNTLLNDFAVDDSIVIVKNEFVTKGFSGISDILGKDTFRGFFKTEGKDKLVSGGRYRPLSLVLFAIVYEIVGSNAFFFHLMTILAFAGLCVLFYKVLGELLKNKFKENSKTIAFIASLLFAIHPIHTECVANIKGMDEILALLFSMGSFWFALKWTESKSSKQLLLSGLCLCLGLFAKENSISFLILIPMGVYLLMDKTFGQSLKLFFYLLIPCFIFLFCRAQILGWNPIAGHSYELMNNPFLKYVNGQYVDYTSMEKLGTIMFTLIKYIGLLFFP
ncbi:MAG: glycosyltransferase family 39 protein, partial [Saprospiraceae bacterium]